MITTSKRIEYIDALRGFTMITVVLWHVVYFGYNKYLLGFSTAIMTFRMPLFFFISGFIFYKESRVWCLSEWLNIFKSKFKVQIIPTVITLAIFIPFLQLDIIEVIQSGTHGGYWFTITLFGYFIIYGLIMLFSRRLSKGKISILAFIIAILLDILTRKSPYPIAHFIMFQYFVYFVFGTIARQYFPIFQKFITNQYISSPLIFIWIVSLVLFHTITELEFCRNFITYFLWGFMGIIIVFHFFEKYQDSFKKETKLGMLLQYIGRRTLDIYLLHYFFIPRNLSIIGDFFEKNPNPTIEIFLSFLIAMLVIGLCLLTSNIIRISPFLAHWMFGVKYNNLK